ncbi:CGGC domain-containing protein [Geosporobacter ferrireducens]|uniref:CGGC domain-containing protein n=1 Tax=Geosporobacter ferrireducens TaxID=1424294 RepID=A0A1D8GDR8_9FIRM|nr:CGGC domain-containing protein [Geosporobacter ferrireducens]AOT69012.1 CGGC domain-containing protein [Geosporobacter ferrireducens]MTI58317.1 CGGC domain-containing protein [Geosporobacter ferrireducens]
MKIAILVNEDTMNRCTGKGCFTAFYQRIDAFSGYDAEAELVGFTHAGGALEYKIEKLVNNGVEVVHLSSCLRAKYPDYEGLAHRLAQHFKVVGYTHGSEKGKRRNTIHLEKKT